MNNRPSAFWRIALALLAAVSLAACGGDDDASDNGTSSNGGDDNAAAPADQSATLKTTEFKFDPDTLTLSAGQAEIVVDNSAGVVEHDFTIDELDLEIYAAPTTTESATVELEAGTYEFYCSIPGHREAGMEGTLTVS